MTISLLTYDASRWRYRAYNGYYTGVHSHTYDRCYCNRLIQIIFESSPH